MARTSSERRSGVPVAAVFGGGAPRGGSVDAGSGGGAEGTTDEWCPPPYETAVETQPTARSLAGARLPSYNTAVRDDTPVFGDGERAPRYSLLGQEPGVEPAAAGTTVVGSSPWYRAGATGSKDIALQKVIRGDQQVFAWLTVPWLCGLVFGIISLGECNRDHDLRASVCERMYFGIHVSLFLDLWAYVVGPVVLAIGFLWKRRSSDGLVRCFPSAWFSLVTIALVAWCLYIQACVWQDDECDVHIHHAEKPPHASGTPGGEGEGEGAAGGLAASPVPTDVAPIDMKVNCYRGLLTGNVAYTIVWLAVLTASMHWRLQGARFWRASLACLGCRALTAGTAREPLLRGDGQLGGGGGSEAGRASGSIRHPSSYREGGARGGGGSRRGSVPAASAVAAGEPERRGGARSRGSLVV